MNVFISHAEADAAFARTLAKGLGEHGLKVWQAATEVLPGDNLWLKLGEALGTADAMVVVLSGRGASQNVRREIEFAMGSPRFRGRLVTILLGDVREVPWTLQRFPLIHAQRRGAARAARFVASHLRRAREKAG